MKRKLSIFVAVALMVTASACSSSTPSEESSTNSTTESVTTTQSSTPTNPSDDYYPITITNYDYSGAEVTSTYTEVPTKVIAGYQGTIETMIALGLEEHLALSFGLDNQVKDQWQAGFSKANYQEDMRFPDKEFITITEPDMIFSWGSLFSEERLGDVSNWNEKGANVYISSNTRAGGHSRTLENEYTDILNIGKIFDVNDKAEALVNEMKDGIADTLASVPTDSSTTVAVIEPISDGFTNYHRDTLAGDMVVSLGGTLSMADSTSIGKEDIVLADPQVIFVVYMAYDGANPQEVIDSQLAKFTEDPAFASLSAVQNNRLIPIMLGDIYASGPRTLDGIQTIAEGIYPEV